MNGRSQTWRFPSQRGSLPRRGGRYQDRHLGHHVVAAVGSWLRDGGSAFFQPWAYPLCLRRHHCKQPALPWRLTS